LAVLSDYLGRICVAIRVKLLRKYLATLGFARSYALRRRSLYLGRAFPQQLPQPKAATRRRRREQVIQRALFQHVAARSAKGTVTLAHALAQMCKRMI
jgi:hypothetical protein